MNLQVKSQTKLDFKESIHHIDQSDGQPVYHFKVVPRKESDHSSDDSEESTQSEYSSSSSDFMMSESEWNSGQDDEFDICKYYQGYKRQKKY